MKEETKCCIHCINKTSLKEQIEKTHAEAKEFGRKEEEEKWAEKIAIAEARAFEAGKKETIEKIKKHSDEVCWDERALANLIDYLENKI